MRRRQWGWSVGLGLCCLALVPLQATADPKPSTPPEKLDAKALAGRIDHHIQANWKANKVKPTSVADDGEFVRRAYLDLVGRIPRVSEVHKFLDSTAPNKRAALVESLLESAGYSTHFSNVWRNVMVPPTTDQLAFGFAPQMELWLNRRLKANTPYDQMVREVLTFPLFNRMQQRPQGGQQQGQPPPDPSVVAFYQANENKAETIAAATSRIFMGIRLECAQCHDHPFNSYSRQQFWEYAAFFGGIRPQVQGDNGRFTPPVDDPKIRQIKIPNTEKVVKAKFLDGSEPKWPSDEGQIDARKTLAEWLTRQENPYFAKAAANRMWAYFFGLGIIDPVDEPSDDNPASHPELLVDLSTQFALNGFDLKYLIRAIALSKTYQLSSLQTDETQGDPRLFGRVSLKGLTPEQLFDSISLATGYKDPNRAATRRSFYRGYSQAEFEFRNKFSNFADRRTEYQTSILQALSMMNGRFVTDATSLTRSETLMGVIDAPFLNTEAKLNTLFLSALSRSMRSEEKSRLVKYVDQGGPSGDKDKALADVFWAILNSSEFMFNH